MNDASKIYVSIEDEAGNMIREFVMYERTQGEIIMFLKELVEAGEGHEATAS